MVAEGSGTLFHVKINDYPSRYLILPMAVTAVGFVALNIIVPRNTPHMLPLNPAVFGRSGRLTTQQSWRGDIYAI